MLLPLRLLVTVRISLKQKLGLTCLFSLGAIVIVFAFIRLSRVRIATTGPRSNPTTMADAPLILSLWSTIEAAIAVIVANLPAFRSLLRKEENTQQTDSKPDRGAHYPKTIGSASKSAIVGRGVEMESLHSFEEVIDMTTGPGVVGGDIELGARGKIVMTRQVSVRSRQREAADSIELSSLKSGLPPM